MLSSYFLNDFLVFIGVSYIAIVALLLLLCYYRYCQRDKKGGDKDGMVVEGNHRDYSDCNGCNRGDELLQEEVI